MALSPFDFLKAINETKEDLFVDPQAEKDYSAYMINRGLSFFPDTILYANMMNRYSHIPKKSQFCFFINNIVKKKRFSQWHKKDKETESLALVMEYFGYSAEKAKEALKILSNTQIDIIRGRQEQGGRG
jgi:hypothetical protein